VQGLQQGAEAHRAECGECLAAVDPSCHASSVVAAGWSSLWVSWEVPENLPLGRLVAGRPTSARGVFWATNVGWGNAGVQFCIIERRHRERVHLRTDTVPNYSHGLTDPERVQKCTTSPTQRSCSS